MLQPSFWKQTFFRENGAQGRLAAWSRHLIVRVEELIAYINDPVRVPDRDKPDELETTFVKLARNHFNGRLEHTLSKLRLDMNSLTAKQLTQAVAQSVSDKDIGRETLLASPTASVHRQQDMTQTAAKAWIMPQDLDTLELPQASVKEMRGMVF